MLTETETIVDNGSSETKKKVVMSRKALDEEKTELDADGKNTGRVVERIHESEMDEDETEMTFKKEKPASESNGKPGGADGGPKRGIVSTTTAQISTVTHFITSMFGSMTRGFFSL